MPGKVKVSGCCGGCAPQWLIWARGNLGGAIATIGKKDVYVTSQSLGRKVTRWFCWVTIVVISGSMQLARGADGVPPTWLPDTTRGYVTITNGPALREAFATTQLSAMVNDPQMQPFVEDLRGKIEQKVSELQKRFGITWRDLESIQAGAWATAAAELEDRNQPFGFVLVVDSTGKDTERASLLQKIAATMKREKAQPSNQKVEGTDITVYTLPREPGERREHRLAIFVRQGWLVATDHPSLASIVATNMAKAPAKSLATTEAFQAVRAEVDRSPLGTDAVHVRWFVHPFGYARILRALDAGAHPRRRNWYQVLSEQGFEAIQGAGGGIRFGTGDDEILHFSHVYAPGAATATTQFKLAARTMMFPNGGGLEPPVWVPDHVGTYARFNWKIKDAFEFSSTLVDALAEQEGFFETVLDGIKTDEYGPKIDLRQELVAFIGERATVISDYELPITPQCERLLVAIEVTDADRVAKALEQTLKEDQTARRLDHNGHVIWELLNSAEEELEVPQVQVVPGFDDVNKEGSKEPHPVERLFPNSAITVAHGQLVWTSHVDFAVRLLTLPPEDKQLANQADFKRVGQRLQLLGSNGDSFRFFSRTEEEYRPTYELIREGKMPQSQTLLGKVLNRLLGPEEKGVLREQRLDGSKLPEYDAVRKYLGPAGTFVKTTDNGWVICGCMLPPQKADGASGDEAAAVTAANPEP